jgi:hypothetical protein
MREAALEFDGSSTSVWMTARGGEGTGTAELHKFSTITETWEDLSSVTLGTPPSPRISFGMTASGEMLYVFGGSISGGPRTLRF